MTHKRKTKINDLIPFAIAYSPAREYIEIMACHTNTRIKVRRDLLPMLTAFLEHHLQTESELAQQLLSGPFLTFESCKNNELPFRPVHRSEENEK